MVSSRRNSPVQCKFYLNNINDYAIMNSWNKIINKIAEE